MTLILQQMNALHHYCTTPQQLIDLFPVPAGMVHRSGTLLFVNRKFADLYLNTVEAMTGKNIQRFSQSIAKNVEDYFLAFERGEDLRVKEVFVYGRYYQLFIHPLYDEQQALQALYVIQWDVSKIKRTLQRAHQTNKRYKEQMMLDPMTGISNVYAMHQYLQQIEKEQVCSRLAILLIDIDLFTAFNKEHGFAKANAAVYSIAQAFKSELYREKDFVIKLSGDRFLVIFPEMSEYTGMTIAERLKRCIYDLNIQHLAGIDQRITVSIIVHHLPFSEITHMNHIIHMLGDQLCQNKKQQRNHCSFFFGEGLEFDRAIEGLYHARSSDVI